jgi:hypothetical protein
MGRKTIEFADPVARTLLAPTSTCTIDLQHSDLIDDYLITMVTLFS